MLRISLDETRSVSGLLTLSQDPFAMLVLAHGAGAGMTHPFMASLAERLARCGVSNLRYQFPYMEAGSRRTDAPPVAHAAVRAAVTAATAASGLPLFAGGKSFGARMTSQAQAAAPLAGVRGLVFFGFPLHPAGNPGLERAQHLGGVTVPMLFVQGTRDALASLELLRPVAAGLLGASLSLVENADHSFHVPVRSGRSDAAVLDDICATAADWMRAMISPASQTRA